MNAVNLKTEIHEIIDRIQSEQLLQALYDFLKSRENTKPGSLWKALTNERKREVLISFEDSEDENSLVDVDKILSA